MKLRVNGYAWQLQKRGALHIHVVLGVKTPAERHAARQYQLRLKETAGSYGFGFVDGKPVILNGKRAAAYLSSYLITGEGKRAAVQEVVQSPQSPARPVYMARRLTSCTGLTMRQLRRRRYLWRLWQDRRVVTCDEHLVDVATGEIIAPCSILRL